MPGRVEGQVAIITGAGNGIGRATAEVFAEEGAKVVVVDVDETGGNNTVEIIKNKGKEAIFLRVDISKEEECIKLADDVVKHFGKVDILVNNAAIFILKSVLQASQADWERSVAVNIIGTALVSKHVAEKMKAHGGSIVNIGSMSSFIAQDNLTAYSATKTAIIGMTRNIAHDLAKYKIRVNCVCPGPIYTPASDRHAAIIGIPIEQFKSEQGKLTSMDRMGEPREIAYPILFLASKEASFINGTHLMADGGYTMV